MSESKCQFHAGDMVVLSDHAHNKMSSMLTDVKRVFRRLLKLEPLTIGSVIWYKTGFYVRLNEWPGGVFSSKLFAKIGQEAPVEDLL